MNNKGFTLIELLAVIVILAIIALIATPIILGIINDVQKDSNERSMELYASAVKNAIVQYQLKNPQAPTSVEQIESYIKYDGDVDCDVVEIYEDGTVYLEGCNINNGTEEFSYGTQQVVTPKFADVCDPVTIATAGTHTLGDTYTCEVKDDVWYTFYVLNTSEANKISLIMDSNINKDGTAVQSGATSDTSPYIDPDTYQEIGEVTDQMLSDAPCGQAGYCVSGIYGPVSANRYLEEATSTWTKVGKLVLSDFVDSKGKAHKIMAAARLPKADELDEAGCPTNTVCPSWLSTNKPSNVEIYWFESEKNNSNMTGYMMFDSGRSGNFMWGAFGIRPVITLSV